MRIIVEIENKIDFDPARVIDWLNDQFDTINRGTGDNFWARLLGVETENDEND